MQEEKGRVRGFGATSERGGVQIWELQYCRECPYLATEECGGLKIRKEMLKTCFSKGEVSEGGIGENSI